jgi:Terminase large subunit, T4likevirus-type, N-terminal
MAFDKNEWVPTRPQEKFLSIPISIKEAFIGGSNGFGKSDVLLVYGLIHRWHENPRFKQVFTRRTFPELRNEIVPRSRQIYSKFGATFNKSDMAWTFPAPGQAGSGMSNAGAMVFLGHCEDESDVYKYDSMEINLYTPDELTSHTEFIYLYIGFTRVRTSDPNLPAIIRGAGTPGGVGHTFVRKRFVDPCPDGGKVIIGKGGNKRIYIHATLAENPHLDPNYRQSLEALPEAEKRAKLYGDWNAYSGQVFDEFRGRKYPDEPINALHVIEPFDIPSWWPKIVVGDWGFRAMTWIGYAAISPQGRVYIYREQYWTQTKISEWAPFVKECLDKENPRLVKFCKSAGQDRGQEHTIQEQISTELGRPIDLTNNTKGSRVAGKQLIHEYLRWKFKPVTPITEMLPYSQEHAMWLIRNRPVHEYKAYVNSFNPPEPETNIPRLQIFDTCKILIDAIKACAYAKSKDGKAAEDIAEFQGDDPIDGLRYLADAAEQYFVESADEFKKIQKQEELAAKVNNDKDWTAFYRNMRTMEANTQGGPISRYHGRRH